MDTSSLKNINIPPLDQFGEIYTIAFPSGVPKMVQREIFDLAPATSRFKMDRKTTNSQSIEASPGKIYLFTTTHEDHLHPPCTGQWDLTSAQNIDLGSLLRSLKSFTLRGYQVFNLRKFHNDISVALSSSTNNNIEVIPHLLDLYRPSTFNVILVPSIYCSLHASCLQIYISVGRIIHSLLTNVVSFKSVFAPKMQRIIHHNSSLTCVWELIRTLYCKRHPNLGGLNKFLVAEIATISIRPNEDLAEFYSRNIIIQKNIDLSKAAIYPNILIKCHIYLLIYCTAISLLLSDKQYLFTIFLSTHGNHSIYKSDTITFITEFLKNWHAPFILKPYSPPSNHPQRSVITSVHRYPIPYEDQIQQPQTTEDPYDNMALSLHDIGVSDIEIAPVMASTRNKKSIVICYWCGIVNNISDKWMARGP